MCNRYASDIRKAGKEKDYYGFDEWSETRINPILGNAVLESVSQELRPGAEIGGERRTRMVEDALGLAWPAADRTSPRHQHPQHQEPALAPTLGTQHRCLVPFTAFSEYEDNSPKGAKQIRWFAPPDRGMLFFAGICGEWWGDYGTKKELNVGAHKLFSFLTTEANALFRPVHAKAMPVILRTQGECEEWLGALPAEIEAIQARVLPTEALEIVPEELAAQYVGGYTGGASGDNL